MTVPYVGILTSNLTRDIQYYTLDGLNYLVPSTRLDDDVSTSSVARWLDLAADPDADWVQPITELGIAPLAGGGAVAARGNVSFTSRWAALAPPDLRWSRFSFADRSVPEGRLLSDSTGRLHAVATERGNPDFTYRLSSDGGRTWAELPVSLPESHTVEDFDFRTNAARGIAVVGIHAHNDSSEADQDLVYEFDIAGGEPVLQRVFFVGAGDLNAGSGLGASIRFDFSTIGILPDGAIVTTFVDAAHQQPALAILVDAGAAGAPAQTPAPPDDIAPTIHRVSDRKSVV